MPETITLVYRDVDRTPLLYAIREMAARHEDLTVEIRQVQGSEEFEGGFLRGEFDLICEHLRFLFPARMAGHPVRCLAACQNESGDLLLARPGIARIDELAGKTVAIRGIPSSRISGMHWLKQLGLEGRVQTLIVDDAEIGRWQQWRKVASGEADAVIGTPLYLDPALAAGLHVLDAPRLPEIGAIFFAALGPYIVKNEDKLRRLMRALYRGLHVFHHEAETAIRIMSGEPARLMGIEGQPEVIQKQFERLRDSLDERPVPKLDSLANTFAMLNQGYARLEGFNALTLWDLHYVLELEEARFAERLASGEL